MSLDFINHSFPADNFFQIEELITRFIAISGDRTVSDSDIPLLQSLLLPFTFPEWKQNASAALAKLLEDANVDPVDAPYYLPALEELSGHVNRLKLEPGENSEAILTLVYSAYHLALYEYSDEKLAEVGWLFKSCLADNVDPKTRGQGSYAGYTRRLQDYIGGQLALHKDQIRQKLLDAQTKSVFDEPELEQLLQPSSSAIVPLSQHHGVASATVAIAPVVPEASFTSSERVKPSMF